MLAVDRIVEILETSGAAQYGNEAVSQLQHALQCAHLAECSGAPDSLVVAALLHDVGHLIHKLGEDAAARGIDDRREALGRRYLARWFDEDVDCAGRHACRCQALALCDGTGLFRYAVAGFRAEPGAAGRSVHGGRGGRIHREAPCV